MTARSLPRGGRVLLLSAVLLLTGFAATSLVAPRAQHYLPQETFADVLAPKTDSIGFASSEPRPRKAVREGSYTRTWLWPGSMTSPRQPAHQ